MRRSSRQSSVAPHPRASRRERGSEASRQASAFSAWREASKCRYAYVNYVVKTLFVTNDYTLVSPSYRYCFLLFLLFRFILKFPSVLHRLRRSNPTVFTCACFFKKCIFSYSPNEIHLTHHGQSKSSAFFLFLSNAKLKVQPPRTLCLRLKILSSSLNT